MTTSPPPPPPPSGPEHPPGWWQASDGNWYPPQGQTQAQPPPGQTPQQAKKGGCLKWAGIALAALVVIGVIAALAGGGSDDETSNDTGGGTAQDGGSTKEADLFPNRPDEKSKDKERNIGQSADLSGYTATVSAATFQQSLNQFERDGYLVANVEIRNRDDEAQSYNTFDWKLITPAGTIIDPTFGADQLGSGDLVTGGVITGKLTWEVGRAKGDYYIIYDPPGIQEDRAVWKATI